MAMVIMTIQISEVRMVSFEWMQEAMIEMMTIMITMVRMIIIKNKSIITVKELLKNDITMVSLISAIKMRLNLLILICSYHHDNTSTLLFRC